MSDERRDRIAPVPDDYENQLTPMQLMALRNIAGFGWELRFIRRYGVDIPIPVVYSGEGQRIGVIEEDGKLNLEPDIKLREQGSDWTRGRTISAKKNPPWQSVGEGEGCQGGVRRELSYKVYLIK